MMVTMLVSVLTPLIVIGVVVSFLLSNSVQKLGNCSGRKPVIKWLAVLWVAGFQRTQTNYHVLRSTASCVNGLWM